MTNTARTVRISAQPAGVNFGFVPVISARNGRTIWIGQARGTSGPALIAAEDKARSEGWIVAGR